MNISLKGTKKIELHLEVTQKARLQNGKNDGLCDVRRGITLP